MEYIIKALEIDLTISTKQIFLNLISNKQLFDFEKIPNELKIDIDIIIESMRNNLLSLLPTYLESDKNVALACINNKLLFFNNISSTLQNDFDIVYECIKNECIHIEEIPEIFIDNNEILIELIKVNPNIINNIIDNSLLKIHFNIKNKILFDDEFRLTICNNNSYILLKLLKLINFNNYIEFYKKLLFNNNFKINMTNDENITIFRLHYNDIYENIYISNSYLDLNKFIKEFSYFVLFMFENNKNIISNNILTYYNNNIKIIEAALKYDGLLLYYLDIYNDFDDEQYLQLYNIAVLQNGLALQYIKNPSRNIIINALTQNGLALKYVEKQDKEFALIATSQNGLALQYILFQDNKNNDIIINSLNNNGLALQFVYNINNNYYNLALSNNGLALQFIKSQNNTLCLLAVKNNGFALKYVQNQTYEICFEAITQNGLALQYVNHNFNKCKNLVLAASLQNPLALQYANVNLLIEFINQLQNINLT